MRKAVLILLFLIVVLGAEAKITLPAIVSSNMVLQRNTTVMVWGWADPKEKFTLEASWIESPIKVKADAEGNWKVEVATTGSKETQTIQIKSQDETIKLENILFGEVWLCSGQSNMVMPMRGFNGQPTFGSNAAIAKSENSKIRLFVVPQIGAKTPQREIGKAASWELASQESVWKFSAIGYFFGQQLQEILDVPVGLIQSGRGGSRVEAWISKEALSEFREVNIEDADMAKSRIVPTAHFNGMINPIIPYTIKGALWYQGEGNFTNPESYKKIFPAMVEDWRTRWGLGDFPFYFVQIAPYFYNKPDVFNTNTNSAFMREAQVECVELIPNSGIAIALDAGEQFNIHPAKKKEVADRLLYNALSQTYGYEYVDGTSPVYDSLEIQEDKILLKFKNVDRGLYAYGELTGFEIAGEDHVFYPAQAKIVNRRDVLVSSEQVLEPVAVRYAWSNWVEGTLYEDSFLPASSFRTDDWEDATRASKEE
ncbi:MAG: sialate O-acetylesterase [Cyclobacteriaceae bacterium]